MIYRKVISFIILIVLVTKLQAQTLNFYYGNIHSHSSYSDGNKDSAITGYSRPYQDFQYAKTAQHFDFLGISEHNHSSAGMAKVYYNMGLSQADSANVNGTFVCMYGMEYGVIGPPGGHMLIYGYNQLIGWDTISLLPNYSVYNSKLDYTSLFQKIAATPGAFATMAHPDIPDYDSLYFRNYNVFADSAFVGCAIRSGPAFSVDTSYADPSTSTYEVRYKDALKKGYHVGAILDHDNHYTTFGKMAQSRTVVLAPSLTRNNIMNAFKLRRTQSSDDWNVHVTFTVNGHVLGSVFNDTTNATISVSVTDPDLEAVSNIKINYGIPGSGAAATQLVSVNGVSTTTYIHSMTTGSSYYYYAVITQADGDKIFTSPIWINKVNVMPVTLLYFNAQYTADKKVNCNWATSHEINAREFIIERSTDAEHLASIGNIAARNLSSLSKYFFTDDNAPEGLIYYRLRETDNDGTESFSNIVSVQSPKNTHHISTYPDPASDFIYVDVSSSQNGKCTLEIFNDKGVFIESRMIHSNQSTQTIPVDVSAFKSGLYLIRLNTNEGSTYSKFLRN